MTSLWLKLGAEQEVLVRKKGTRAANRELLRRLRRMAIEDPSAFLRLLGHAIDLENAVEPEAELEEDEGA